MYLFTNRIIQEKYCFRVRKFPLVVNHSRSLLSIFENIIYLKYYCYKMTRLLPILFIIFHFQSTAQTAKIDTLFFQVSERFKPEKTLKLKFPIIRTGNKNADLLINTDLKDKITYNEYPGTSTDSALSKWGNDIITDMNFEVTYNQKGIISLTIYSEGCGAYCSSGNDYFNYSLVTGKSLNLNDIVDTTGSFRAKVYTDLHQQYETQRSELKELVTSDQDGEFDQTKYNWVLENYNSCEQAFDFTSFALYVDRLEIMEHCYLSNAIKNLSPIIELKYTYADIKEYLKTIIQ